MFSEVGALSCMKPGVKEGLGTNSDLKPEFDAEGLECGGNGVEAEGGCNKPVEGETDNGWCCSTAAGSVGIWKDVELAPCSAATGGFSAVIGRLLRYQRNTQKRMKRIPAHAPTTIPPMVPPSSLNESDSVISSTKKKKLCSYGEPPEL